MRSDIISTTADAISSGGTITGDLTISGDLTVEGGGGFSYSEVLTGDMKITNAGATIGLEVNQTGNATAMKINQDDTDQVALEIDTEATGATALYFNSPANIDAHVIHISSADSLTTGSAMKVSSNAASTSARNLIDIVNTNVLAVQAVPLKIQQFSLARSIFVDQNTSGVGASDVTAVHIDYDRTVAGSGTAAHNDIGIDLDVNSASLGTSSVIGMDIDVVGATSGTHTATGLTVDVSGADTNYAALFNGGNVGIGGTPTVAKLEVHGGGYNTSLLIKGSGDHSGIRFVDSAGNTDGYVYADSGNCGFLDDDAEWALKVITDTSVDLRVSDSIKLLLDANSRISLSNNDSGGTGGEDSTSGNTILGYLSGAAIASGGLNNTTIGHKAGNAISTADNNVFIGALAGSTHLTGGRNTAIGSQAMFNTDEDSDSNSSISNVFIGAQAGGGTWAGETSNHNIGIGDLALGGALEGGDGTIAIGSSALGALTSGAGNVAVGYEALLSEDTGDGNTAVGYRALKLCNGANDNGNTAVGYTALSNLTGGIKNTAMGYQAGLNIIGGTNNTAVGYNALYTEDEGDYNTAIGDYALYLQNVGSGAGNNVGIGRNAGYNNVTGTDNTYVGTSAGTGGTGNNSNNVGVGSGALTAITDGGRNVAIGKDAFVALTGGLYNVAIGYQAGYGTVSADTNTFIGYQAGYAITASGNVVIGRQAFATASSVVNNVCIGHHAMQDVPSGQAINNCVSIGYQALHGSSNTTTGIDGTVAIGKDALTSLTTGAGNTAVGYQALDAEDAGGNSTAVGFQALSAQNNDTGHNTAVGWTAGDSIVAGYSNTLIGSEAGTTGSNDLASGNQNTLIGQATSVSRTDATNQTVIGRGTEGQANNSVTLGNASVTDVYMAMDVGARFTIGTGGAVTMPNQPAFLVIPAATQADFAIGSEITIVFGTEVFDQGADFASNTFTAPVTGKYQLNVNIRLTTIDSDADYYYIALKTTQRNYTSAIFDPDFGQDGAYWNLTMGVLADMDASDTAYVVIHQGGGTQQTDIETAAGRTFFSGYLVC